MKKNKVSHLNLEEGPIKTKTIGKISSKKQGSRSVATKKCCNEIPIYNRFLVI